MRATRLQAAASCVPSPSATASPHLAVLANEPPSRGEALADRILRLVGETDAIALPPGVLRALSPAHPDSETFLCFLATTREVHPLTSL
jgi:hypothetical protein